MSAPRLEGPRTVLVPLALEHAAALRAIRATPEVSARWSDDDGFPLHDEPEATRYVVLLGGDPEPRGLVQFGEEDAPDYRHASIDIFLDPAADNAPAIACYSAVGFRPVGIMRRCERGPDTTFHDGVLMDLLADELVRAR